MRDVTVVIPTYGRPELLEKCLDCLPNDLIKFVVDDATPKEESGAVQEVVQARRGSGVRLLKGSTNQGFPATANRGMGRVATTYALILNTDVFLQGGALDILQSEIEKEDVGIAAPMLLFGNGTQFGPEGRIQHVGMAFDIYAQPQHIFLGWSTSSPRAVQRREVNCVTGACMMVKVATWRRIGGFALEYGRGTYEDVEYCVRTRILGQKIIVNPEAIGVHMVGQSSAVRKLGFPLQQNYAIFRSRVGQAVKNDDFLYW